MPRKEAYRWVGLGIAVLLWAGAALGAGAVPNPVVTGPIASGAIPGSATRDYVFFATDHPLAVNGYVEEEFFIEGTRSRTGKTLQPRLGLLRMVVEVYARGVRRELYLVPVGFTYDRLVEETSMAEERRGAPKSGESLDAAALVWSKAPVIVGAHDTGPLIRSKEGFWLAIPLPAAGKSLRGGRITPGEWERRRGLRLRCTRSAAALIDSPRVTTSMIDRPRTLRELKESGWRPTTVKLEMRCNLLARLRRANKGDGDE